MFDKLFGDKNLFQSLTAWGLILKAAVGAGEGTGVVPPGTAESSESVVQTFATLIDQVGNLLIVLGLRKAATAPNTQ